MAHRMTDGTTDGLACLPAIGPFINFHCRAPPSLQGTQCRTVPPSEIEERECSREDFTGMIGVDETEGFLLDGPSDFLAPVSFVTGQCSRIVGSDASPICLSAGVATTTAHRHADTGSRRLLPMAPRVLALDRGWLGWPQLSNFRFSSVALFHVRSADQVACHFRSARAAARFDASLRLKWPLAREHWSLSRCGCLVVPRA